MPFFSASSSAIPCSAAYFRTSSVIFIEQKCGPHMLQKCAVSAPSWGRVSSWNSRTVSGISSVDKFLNRESSESDQAAQGSFGGFLVIRDREGGVLAGLHHDDVAAAL